MRQSVFLAVLLIFYLKFSFGQKGIMQPPADDFTLIDTKGTTWNLYQQLDSGKTVVLDFFSTGCGSCVSAIPLMNQLWLDYGSNDGNVLIWAIEVTGADSFEVDTFLNYYGGHYTAFSSVGQDTIIDLYDLTYTPTYYVVCPNRMRQLCVLDSINGKIIVCQSQGVKDEISAAKHLIVSPNPFSDYLKLDFKKFVSDDNYQFKIYSVEGVNIINTSVNSQTKESIIDTRSLKSGVYFFKLIYQGITVDQGTLLKLPY